MSNLPRHIKHEVQKLPAVTRDIVAQRMRNTSIPVVYEEACKALAACVTIDEGKYWADKAEALAAWAKIYKSKQAETEAKRLKLHAYRRMGQIAEELRPTVNVRYTTDKERKLVLADRRKARRKGTHIPEASGQKPGAVSLLVEHGIPTGLAVQIKRISRIEEKDFKEIVSRDEPPSTTKAAVMGIGTSGIRTKGISSGSYREFSQGSSSCPISLRSWTRKHSAVELAQGMTVDEAKKAREIVIELQEWLDAFEQALPK